MNTTVDMDIKVDMETREDMATTKVAMATTKVAMAVMVTTKVDMEDMKMEAGTTTGTEAVAAEDEAIGAMVVLDMTVVAEAQVALAAGAMFEAVDEWVAAVDGATKTTIRARAFSTAVLLYVSSSPPRF